MIFQNEKKLLKIIKYTPSIFIIVISIIILSLQFIEKNSSIQKEKYRIKQEYKNKNKEIIKQRVNEVYNYIKREKELTTIQLKKSLKDELTNAYNIANAIYEKNKDLPKEKIKKIIIEALREIRFNNNRGYFFIYEKSGINLLLPHNPELEGKDFLNHKDSKGTLIIQNMIKILSKKNESYYEWFWYNPISPDIMRKKIGLVKNFKPFNWFIGTGEYIEDFEKEVQEKVLRNIKEMRFGKNGYIFIIRYDTVYLSHIRKNFIGNSAVKNNDTISIKKVIKDLVKIAKKGEGYYTYVQNKKPDNNRTIYKTSYVKGFNDWKWMIGTGYYEDDINNQIELRKKQLDENFRKSAIQIIKYAGILIVLLLLCSIYFSKILQRRFEKYKDEINLHIKESNKQQNLIAHQSKMAAMGEMIGNIAHQWRQPLSTITTTATGLKLQKEMDLLKDDFLIEGLDGINNSAQYLSQTIDDFRNFFKSDNKVENFEISEVINKALALVSVQFHNSNIEIIKKIEKIELKGYPNQLIQVIINLLNNAKDELIKKKADERKIIYINIFKNNFKIHIQIKDNAGGIPEEIISRIFEPYFTTKYKSQGTGIGLFMSREIIIKNMFGSIEVENYMLKDKNIEYKGALFEIILPLDITI
ncbi:MAG: cache domain-containing protein [Halarcobacter sp.]